LRIGIKNFIKNRIEIHYELGKHKKILLAKKLYVRNLIKNSAIIIS
jgi:hypothetical protein